MKDYTEEIIDYFDLNVIKIEAVEESYSSTVKLLILNDGDKIIIKTPFSNSKFQREKRVLETLQGKLPVPSIIDWWQPSDSVPGVLLLSFIPGKPITGELTSDISFKLGVLLGKLHSNKLKGFGDDFDTVNESSLTWWEVLNDLFLRRVPNCENVISKELLARVLNKYEELYSNLPEPDGPCMVHFDYRPGNILMQNNEITGLIDFESARGGSADVDFVTIKKEVWDVSQNTKKAFLNGYRSIRELPNLDDTLTFYEIYNAFSVIAWCAKRDKTQTSYFYQHLEKLKSLT